MCAQPSTDSHRLKQRAARAGFENNQLLVLWARSMRVLCILSTVPAEKIYTVRVNAEYA